jgi:hypothetical protein
MLDPNAQAGYERALEARGKPVIVVRESGVAPNVAIFQAQVLAIIADYKAQTPIGETKPEGGITMGARSVIVLAHYLREKKFPLPLQKNDKVILLDEEQTDPSQQAEAQPDGTTLYQIETLNVMSADPYTRAIAGAIELMAEGV